MSSKEGTVPAAVATMLAQPGLRLRVATRVPRMRRLVEVEMTETVA